MREPIICPKISITDMLDMWKSSNWDKPEYSRNKIINIRGCNGAGKSTIPLSMLKDPFLTILTWNSDGKEKAFATMFPTYGFIAIGTYKNKTGGLDTYKTNEQTRIALELLWNSPFNIIMEGVIASTIKSTYVELFQSMSDKPYLRPRVVTIMSIVPPFQTCLDRIYSRNGGKEIDEKGVESKWNTVKRNVKFFEENGINSIEVDNSTIQKQDTLEWFLDIVRGLDNE